MVISLNTPTAGGLRWFYPSTLDVPHELVEHVSWLIYTRRRELRSPWR
ncbi:IS5/IS1182 family transposase, partial [Streptomyces sp. NPDC005483]